MRNIKVNDATGTVIARLARPALRNSELGLQVRDTGVSGLLLDVTRAHNMNHAYDTIVSTVMVSRNAILKLAEQLKAEYEQRAAHYAYQAGRMEENKRAGRPIWEGADENGVFPPRHDEGQERQRNDAAMEEAQGI